MLKWINSITHVLGKCHHYKVLFTGFVILSSSMKRTLFYRVQQSDQNDENIVLGSSNTRVRASAGTA